MFKGFCHHRSLLVLTHAYTTRLSSDLLGLCRLIVDLVSTGSTLRANDLVEVEHIAHITSRLIVNRTALKTRPAEIRSEEHTSELQPLLRISYAVFCLKT